MNSSKTDQGPYTNDDLNQDLISFVAKHNIKRDTPRGQAIKQSLEHLIETERNDIAWQRSRDNQGGTANAIKVLEQISKLSEQLRSSLHTAADMALEPLWDCLDEEVPEDTGGFGRDPHPPLPLPRWKRQNGERISLIEIALSDLMRLCSMSIERIIESRGARGIGGRPSESAALHGSPELYLMIVATVWASKIKLTPPVAAGYRMAWIAHCSRTGNRASAQWARNDKALLKAWWAVAGDRFQKLHKTIFDSTVDPEVRIGLFNRGVETLLCNEELHLLLDKPHQAKSILCNLR